MSSEVLELSRGVSLAGQTSRRRAEEGSRSRPAGSGCLQMTLADVPQSREQMKASAGPAGDTSCWRTLGGHRAHGTSPRGEPIAVRHSEGLAHGFVILQTAEGTALADGDLIQTSSGARVTTRLI